MKVLNFLEYVKETNLQFWEQLDNAVEFYSQPFKPEMITELFEGWNERQSEVYMNFSGSGLHSVTNIIELYFDKIDMITYGTNIIRNDFPDQIYRVYKPQTLDDFIRDCQRAGIELTWKPEIINKYFK